MLVFVYAAGIGEVSGPGVLRADSAMESLIGQDLPCGTWADAGGAYGRSACEGLRYEEPCSAWQRHPTDFRASPRTAGCPGRTRTGRRRRRPSAHAAGHGKLGVGVPTSPGRPGILRNLARLAGAHIYSDTDDALYAGRGVIALHARTAGPKAIQLPRQLRVRELLGGDGRERTTDRIEFDASAFETRVFEVDVP